MYAASSHYSRGLRAVGELQALAEGLQRDREEVDALSRSRASLTREIEAAHAALSDTRASVELETRSIEALKARAVTAREETDKWEAEAHKAKSLADEENTRLRTVRAVAGEQVKMLQQELNQIQISLRASRRATGEQEQLRRDLEEEMARRKADGESMQLALARELDDASRKLTSIKTEIRGLRLEADKMSISKRQGEEEYSAMEERKMGLLDLIATLEEKSVKKTEAFERLSAEQEKKIKTLRDALASMMSERDILQSSVDDFKKQLADLEAVSVSKRRAIDDEISQAQQQALASIRASRSAVVACEQKKVEAERIDAECRAAERRLDELQRGVRDAEMKQDRLQESIRLLASDKERSENQLEALRKEEDALRLNIKASDEIRRRLVSLAEEEASLKLSESKLKSSLSAVCKQIESAQHELEEMRGASERERRLSLELRSQRAALEAEGARAEREVAFLREQMTALEQQEADVRLRISRSVDELSRVQKDLVGLQRKNAEASRMDDEMRRKERAAEASMGSLQAELETTVARLTTERAHIEQARNERERVLTEVRAAQDELLLCKQEAASVLAAMEKTRGEKQSLEAQKTDLIKEMHEMRETNRAEASRSESMSRSYEELERRLRAVREDVQRAEANYAKARELSAAEEERVRQQQRAVADAAAELHAIEGLLQQNSKELHESRVRSLAELGQLSRAKQSMNNHMLLLAEAQNRPFASPSASAAQSASAPSPALEAMRPAHVIRFTPADSDRDESDAASSLDPAEAARVGGPRGASPSSGSEVEVGAEIGAALESEMRRLHRKTEEILARSRPPL
jgi:chromosome segregation ATPase